MLFTPFPILIISNGKNIAYINLWQLNKSEPENRWGQAGTWHSQSYKSYSAEIQNAEGVSMAFG